MVHRKRVKVNLVKYELGVLLLLFFYRSLYFLSSWIDGANPDLVEDFSVVAACHLERPFKSLTWLNILYQDISSLSIP